LQVAEAQLDDAGEQRFASSGGLVGLDTRAEEPLGNAPSYFLRDRGLPVGFVQGGEPGFDCLECSHDVLVFTSAREQPNRLIESAERSLVELVPGDHSAPPCRIAPPPAILPGRGSIRPPALVATRIVAVGADAVPPLGLRASSAQRCLQTAAEVSGTIVPRWLELAPARHLPVFNHAIQ
jgi:hypothetical protein